MRSDGGLRLSRSWTTRARRALEAPDAYTFVDRAAFEAEIARGGFLEWAEVFGELYGTPVPDRAAEADLLLEIDVQGARQVREREPGAVVIFLVAPSRAAQEERLRGRGDDPEVVARRLAAAEAEEAEGMALAQHVVVNDDLRRAVEEVAGILARERAVPLPVPPARPRHRPPARPEPERP